MSRRELTEATVQLIGITAVALSGGNRQAIQQGATTTLTADRFNRQLHPDEIKWIEKNADKFAQQQGISIETAKQRLAQQAIGDVDVAWSGYLGGKTDQAAKDFLTSEGGKSTFLADDGSRQTLFTVRNGEQFDGAKYAADNANPESIKFYQTYIQPGKVNGDAGAVGSAAWQGTKALPGKVWKGTTDCLSKLLDCATGIATNLPSGIAEGFKSAGTSLGGATAATFDDRTANILKQLYGSDNAPYVVATIAASPAASMVIPLEKAVSITGKGVVKGGNAALDAAGRAWETRKIIDAEEIAASAKGTISAQKVTTSGVPAALDESSVADLKGLSKLDHAAAGALRETVANDYFVKNGFTPLDGKCGVNCFDGVYIKDGKVIINEVKPLNADNSIQLNGPNKETRLDTQMTRDWIESRAQILKDSGDPAKMATAQTIREALKTGNLVTLVSGVNSADMTMVQVTIK